MLFGWRMRSLWTTKLRLLRRHLIRCVAPSITRQHMWSMDLRCGANDLLFSCSFLSPFNFTFDHINLNISISICFFLLIWSVHVLLIIFLYEIIYKIRFFLLHPLIFSYVRFCLCSLDCYLFYLRSFLKFIFYDFILFLVFSY